MNQNQATVMNISSRLPIMQDGNMRKIKEMILKFNGLRGEFQINYACGYAYSEDYPGLTLLDLLNEADQKMYDDKIRTKKDQKNIH